MFFQPEGTELTPSSSLVREIRATMPVVQVALLVLLLLPSAKVVASAVATASSGRENLRSGVRTMREGSSFTIYGKAGEQRARTASGASSRHHIQGTVFLSPNQ